MPNNTCSVTDCNRERHCRGYCSLHYARLMRTGDPLRASVGEPHAAQRDESGLKICKKCREAKPDSEFHKDGSSPDGLRAQCKPCRNGFMAEYYADNRESRIEYERNRRRENGDHLRAWDKARYERDREKRISLAEKHGHLRRARLAGVKADKGLTVKKLRKSHGDCCCYCGVLLDFTPRPRGEGIGADRATLEHVMPISRGGTHTFDNAALACHSCNTSKNNKTILEWLEWKAGGPNGGQEEAASRPAG